MIGFIIPLAPRDLSAIVFGIAVGALVIGTPVVFLIKWNGKRKFRESWKREHTGP